MQVIDGKTVYVVDLEEMPELPITWATPDEEAYARCLQAAIEQKVITKPGKYAIEHIHDDEGGKYQIHQVIE